MLTTSRVNRETCYWDNERCGAPLRGINRGLCPKHAKMLKRVVAGRIRRWKKLPWYLKDGIYLFGQKDPRPAETGRRHTISYPVISVMRRGRVTWGVVREQVEVTYDDKTGNSIKTGRAGSRVATAEGIP